MPDWSGTPAAPLVAVYHVRADAASIEERARAIAVEQSVEMPLAAIEDDRVRSQIVGRVAAIEAREPGMFEVRVALSAETVGADAGQLVNMLFGNTSIHDDVALYDADIPPELAKRTFGGPRHGLAGLRKKVGAPARALTCSALKPQGLPAGKLAALAAKFALGGIDYIKDDHGLADQTYSPFAARVAAIVPALRAVEQATGRAARYVPSLSGDLDTMRRQVDVARQAGIEAVMVAPVIAGFANFHRLVRDNADLAFFAHPALAGAARIAPPFLIGKLFRLLGADAVIFPNYGGRFGYSPETCRKLARAALADWAGMLPSVPTPAGGMSLDRVAELLDFYGKDTMLLIGGALLSARERLLEAAAAFVAEVERHGHG